MSQQWRVLELTQRFVDDVEPEETRRQYRDGRVHQLLLQVEPSGRKVYKLRFSHKGRRYDETLSPAQDMKLQTARRLASELVEKTRSGEREQDEHSEELTMSRLSEKCRASRRFKNLEASTQSYYTGYFDRIIIPAFGPRSIESISRAEIIELLETSYDKNGSRASNAVRDSLNKIYGYAVQQGHIDHNLIRSIDPLYRQKPRERYLSEREIRLFLSLITEGPLRRDVSDALQFCLLTGARRTEVTGMTWKEIDFEQSLWTVPIERTKKKKSVYLNPLSEASVQFLKEREVRLGKINPDDRLFPIRADSLTQAMRRLTERFEFDERYTPHDLRRTMATNLSRMGTSDEMIERVLNHAPPGRAIRSYIHHNYVDQKRHALELWAAYLQKFDDPEGDE